MRAEREWLKMALNERKDWEVGEESGAGEVNGRRCRVCAFMTTEVAGWYTAAALLRMVVAQVLSCQ